MGNKNKNVETGHNVETGQIVETGLRPVSTSFGMNIIQNFHIE